MFLQFKGDFYNKEEFLKKVIAILGFTQKKKEREDILNVFDNVASFLDGGELVAEDVVADVPEVVEVEPVKEVTKEVIKEVTKEETADDKPASKPRRRQRK